MKEDELIADLKKELASKDALVKAKDDAIKAKDDATKAKDDAIKARDDAIKARDDAIKAKDETIKAKDDAIIAKDEALKAKDALVASMGADCQVGQESLTPFTNPPVDNTRVLAPHPRPDDVEIATALAVKRPKVPTRHALATRAYFPSQPGLSLCESLFELIAAFAMTMVLTNILYRLRRIFQQQQQQQTEQTSAFVKTRSANHEGTFSQRQPKQTKSADTSSATRISSTATAPERAPHRALVTQDVVFRCLSFLDLKDFANTARTCRAWSWAAKNVGNTYWRTIACSRWPEWAAAIIAELGKKYDFMSACKEKLRDEDHRLVEAWMEQNRVSLFPDEYRLYLTERCAKDCLVAPSRSHYWIARCIVDIVA